MKTKEISTMPKLRFKKFLARNQPATATLQVLVASTWHISRDANKRKGPLRDAKDVRRCVSTLNCCSDQRGNPIWSVCVLRPQTDVDASYNDVHLGEATGSLVKMVGISDRYATSVRSIPDWHWQAYILLQNNRNPSCMLDLCDGSHLLNFTCPIVHENWLIVHSLG